MRVLLLLSRQGKLTVTRDKGRRRRSIRDVFRERNARSQYKYLYTSLDFRETNETMVGGDEKTTLRTSLRGTL